MSEPVAINTPLPIPNSKSYRMGQCTIIVSRNELMERGVLVLRWHLSISRPDRYPSWGEIHRARYALIPDEATMAMILPPKAEYVNLHPNCFHLHEIEGEA